MPDRLARGARRSRAPACSSGRSGSRSASARGRRARSRAGTAPAAGSGATRAWASLLRRQAGASRARADLVADAPDRDDRRRVAELAPQLAHVDVDRARVARERVAPDPLEQLVARQHEAAVVEQLPEQVELLRRELDLLARRRGTSRRPASTRGRRAR